MLDSNKHQGEKLTEGTDSAMKDGWIAWLVKGKLDEKWPNFSKKRRGVLGTSEEKSLARPRVRR